MTKMMFYKYEGAGNDFILVEDFSGAAPKDAKFVVRACDRHFGIGADGVLYAQKGKNGNYRMQLMNSDGSETEMCGNGIRCLAKHLVDFGYVKEGKFDIETLAGIKTIEARSAAGKGGKVETVVVGMGKPQFLGTADVGNEHLTLVSMGNPHAIAFKKRISMDEVMSEGPRIEKNPRFPGRTNVEFAHVKNDHEIELVVYERGAGLTLACGTGACATVAAAAKEHLVNAGKPVSVMLPGGKLIVTVTEDYSGITMEGPARFVFSGEIAF